MARPSKEPPASSRLVPAIVRYAQARGVDVEAWRWRFGLPADVATVEECAAPASTAEELIEALASATAERDVARTPRAGDRPQHDIGRTPRAGDRPQHDIISRLAAEPGGNRQRVAELAVRASPDVRDALVRLARWTPLLHEGLEAQLTDDGKEARWTLRTPRRPRGLGRHVHELVLAYTLLQARAGAGEFPVAHAWFVHPRPRAIDAVSTLLRTTELAFGCEDSGFALSPEALALPMRFADARTVETLSPLVDAEVEARPGYALLGDRVAGHIASSLPQGADVAEVAHAMRMSPRTLQRRLEQEGTRFSEVLDRARLDVAKRLLADARLPLAEIAFRLGFADVATLSRAFKRWTGVPPGQWRRS
jgi:AraC-like DNA-binding protein